MSRYFESDAARNQEDAVARVLESGAVAPPSGAIDLVQSVSAHGAPNYTISLSLPVTVGNYIIVSSAGWQSSPNLASDTLGHTWTEIGSLVDGGGAHVRTWLTKVATAGTCTISITSNGGASTAGEFSGLAASGVLLDADNTTGQSTAPAAAATGTLSQDNCLVYAAMSNNLAGMITMTEDIADGFELVGEDENNDAYQVISSQWKATTTTASVTPDWTISGNADWGTQRFVLKGAPVAVTPPVFRSVKASPTFGSANITLDESGMGLVEGDVVLAFATAEDSASDTISFPADFTLLRKDRNPDAPNMLTGVYWTRRTTSAIGSSWTLPAGGAHRVTLVAYSSCKTTGSPINAHSVANYQTTGGGGLNGDAAPVTTTVPGCLLVGFRNMYNWAFTSSTTYDIERFDDQTSIAVYEDAGLVAAAGTSPTLTISPPDAGWHTLIALEGASGGAPPGGAVALVGSTTGLSNTTGLLGVAIPVSAVTVPGLSTTTATMAVARALVAVAPAGLSTTTGALARGVPLAGTSTGLSSDSGVSVVAVALVGTTAGLSNTAGTLEGVTTHLMVGTAAGGSTTTGALAVARPLAGSTGGLSTTTGTMATAVVLVGSAAGLSTTTGALAAARPLAGSAAASSTTTATATVAVALTGTSPGLSTTTGSLARAVPLTATAAGLSTTTAAARNAVALVGTITGTSQTQGLMEGTAATPLVGTTAGLSSTTGALLVAKALVAVTTPGTSTTTAALGVALPLSATTTPGTSTTTGAMAVARSLIGTTTGGSTTTAAMGGSSGLGGSATGGSTTTGTMAAIAKALSGSTTGTSTTTANLTSQAPNSLTGTTGGSSTTTGNLGVAMRLGTASAGGLSTATGSLGKAVPLVGVTVPGSSTSTATIAISRALAGSSSGLSTALANARVAVALIGTAGGQSTVLAVMPVHHALVGASVGRAATTGNLQVIFIAPIYGIWNGQPFDAMQYGDKQVTAWLLIPS